MHTPPPGRAGNRARLIARFRNSADYAVHWHRIVRATDRATMEIPRDPAWDGVETWRQSDRLDGDGMIQTIRATATVEQLFRFGRYAEALRQAGATGLSRSENRICCGFETYCLLLARQGLRARTLEALQALPDEEEFRFPRIATELFCRINLGLVPNVVELAPLVEEGDRLGTERPDLAAISPYHYHTFRQSAARVRMQQGRDEEALAILDAELADPDREGRPRMSARSRGYRAEILHRRGIVDEAFEETVEACKVQLGLNLSGDMAEHSLPVLAKILRAGAHPMAPSSGEAWLKERLSVERLDPGALLQLAEKTQRALENDLALARVLCLRGRILGEAHYLLELQQLRERVDSLAMCPLAERIISHWSEWVAGPPDAGHDDYWGL
jgi:hypothetical protein